MSLIQEVVMAAPKPVMALMIFLLGFGFASLCIMNKNLRRKLRDLRKELSAALKGHPKPHRSKKPQSSGNKTTHKTVAKVPPRPT